MAALETVAGQHRAWSLLKKLGEGDAGEVYLVESLLEKKGGILKRPHRSSYSSDFLRQSAQIEAEGKILRTLGGISVSSRAGRAVAPALLDQSKSGTEYSERLFIVVEKAPGYDLNFLARAVHFGQADLDGQLNDFSRKERSFMKSLVKHGQVPQLVWLRALSCLLGFFERIHTLRATIAGQEKYGLIWNDVKPEHLFWDPSQACFTLIDWGNGQFLEADGTTKDRSHTRGDDYLQFKDELGRFLAGTAPGLYTRLEWPEEAGSASACTAAITELKERIWAALLEELANLEEVRLKEASLIHSPVPHFEQFQELDTIHTEIAGYGELPDDDAAAEWFVKLADRLALENRLVEFQQLCETAREISALEVEKWILLGQLAEFKTRCSENAHQLLIAAIQAGIYDDWSGLLWNLLAATGGNPQPAWWDDLSRRVRQIQFKPGTDTLTPFVIVSRGTHTLEAASQKLWDSVYRGRTMLAEVPECQAQDVQAFANLIKALREEVIKKWTQLEPDPPDSGLGYSDIDRLLDEIGKRNPEIQQALVKALDQPKAKVKIIMDAWGRKDFEMACRGLRHLLSWDPDRRRVLQAERAILAAPDWLERVYLGPKKNETIQDFITQVELEARELRNQVGPVRWLDLILEALARLRKGADPADLVLEHPELLADIPWLNDYEARKPKAILPSKSVKLEREPSPPGLAPILGGVKEGALGEGGEMTLAEPLDTWAPEARGSSARVFTGFFQNGAGLARECAVKILRGDRADYGLPLFREEVQILTLMRDVPGMVRLVELGFIQLEGEQALPSDERPIPASNLQGAVVRMGVNEVREFVSALERRIGQGWLPYLALEKKSRADNLMVLCDAGYNRGRFLSTAEILRMAIQICDILGDAHARNIVYRDHKILHYYWQEADNGIFLIDWNVARRHPQGLSSAEKQFDLVQFGARGLHHILTGRTAPGALPLGPTRPEEIEQAAHTYRVQWTYDDQRLPDDVKHILERVLAGGYSQVRELREDLYQSFQSLTGAR